MGPLSSRGAPPNGYTPRQLWSHNGVRCRRGIKRGRSGPAFASQSDLAGDPQCRDLEGDVAEGGTQGVAC